MSGNRASEQHVIAVDGQNIMEIKSTTLPEPGTQLFEILAKYKISVRFVHSSSKNIKPVVFQGAKPPKGSHAILIADGKVQTTCTWDELPSRLQPDTSEIWAVRPVRAVVVLLNTGAPTEDKTSVKKQKKKA